MLAQFTDGGKISWTVVPTQEIMAVGEAVYSTGCPSVEDLVAFADKRLMHKICAQRGRVIGISNTIAHFAQQVVECWGSAALAGPAPNVAPTKQQMVDMLETKGKTTMMSKSGNAVKITARMPKVDLQEMLDELEELEVDGSAVEEGAEEEFQDDIDDVIYLAHL